MTTAASALPESTDRHEATLVIIAQLRPGTDSDFAHWQGRLNAHLFTIPGFLSLESQSPHPPRQLEWVNILRFENASRLHAWQASPAHAELINETRDLVEGRLIQLPGTATRPICEPQSVTEVIVTHVAEGREAAYREWAGKIQLAFSQAAGFQGVTSQRQANGTAWTTLLRFDTAVNLDQWLQSNERAQLLEEARELIEQVHRHRVEPSFPGWIGMDAGGQPPPRWKTTMLVLLSLYPVANFDVFVVLPRLPHLPLGISYFLPYVLGVILISYLLMPFFVRLFSPWLYAGSNPGLKKNIIGTGAILALYALEIVVIYWLFHGGFR